MIKPFGLVQSALFMEPVAYIYVQLTETPNTYMIADMVRLEMVPVSSVDEVMGFIESSYAPEAKARFYAIKRDSPYFFTSQSAYEKVRLLNDVAQKPQWVD